MRNLIAQIVGGLLIGGISIALLAALLDPNTDGRHKFIFVLCALASYIASVLLVHLLTERN